ncbi:MAG: hypothetical protein ACOC8E_02265 [Planctomycetota bacterium]
MYDTILTRVFENHYTDGIGEFEFERDEIVVAAEELGLPRPKNIGDVLYTFRYRKSLPDAISDTAPAGTEWVIEGAGAGKYRFRLTEFRWIEPRQDLIAIKVPDATPELVAA